jgi:hypothetical protein
MAYLIGRYLSSFFGVVTVFLPAGLNIAQTPAKLFDVLQAMAWKDNHRELIFAVVGVLCISVLDGIDSVVKSASSEMARVFSMLIVALSFLLAVCCAAWASSPEPATMSDVRVALGLLFLSLVASLIQRTILVLELTHD